MSTLHGLTGELQGPLERCNQRVPVVFVNGELLAAGDVRGRQGVVQGERPFGGLASLIPGVDR